MARARLLKPGFFTNELLAELPFEGRLLFAGLWTLADREGRLEDRPKRIKAALFPWDEVDVDGLLSDLEAKGFVERYESGILALVQIAKFSDHQTPHVREAASVYPAPSKGDASPSPRSPVPIAVSVPVTGNGSNSTESLTRSAPVVGYLVFPVVGKGGGEWELEEPRVVEWEKLYPNLDVRSEMRHALAWAQSNPGRRKTAKGMPAFLVNWLNRATDRRGGSERRETPRAGDRRDGVSKECPHEPKCANRPICWARQQQAQEKVSA